MSFLEKLGTEASCFETGYWMKPDTLRSLETQEQHPWDPRQPCCAPALTHPTISCSWGFPLQSHNTTHLFSKQDQLFIEAASKVSVQCVNFPIPLASSWEITNPGSSPAPAYMSSPPPLQTLSKKPKWCFGAETKFSKHGTGFYSCPLSLIKHRVH